jgi:hypothetical protein
MTSTTTIKSVVFTNCTGRKLQKIDVVRLQPMPLPASVDALCTRWLGQLEDGREVRPVEALYAGRSFQDARRAATILGAPMYVASAGLGMIAASEEAPAYDLTIADSGATILPILRQIGATRMDWWRSLNAAKGHPQRIASEMAHLNSATWYVAMPGTYLSMLSEELVQLPVDATQRLRIFTSSAWAHSAPPVLANQVLPYDERLEGTRFPGTRGDFAQRALLHFLEDLAGHDLALDEAKDKVANAMSRSCKRELPRRTKKSDQEIIQILRVNWQEHDGAAGRLLRFLRDTALIQCEQTRFKSLWHCVRDEMNGSNL